MAKVTAFEAKTRFGELLNRVSEGEEVVITRHDKPVARLVPEGAQRSADVRRAVAGLRQLQQQIRRRSKAKLSNREIRSAINEGRLCRRLSSQTPPSLLAGCILSKLRLRPQPCSTPSPKGLYSKYRRCGHWK